MGKQFGELTAAEREVFRQYHAQQASVLERQQQQEQLVLQQQGHDVARQAAQLLKDRFGATRVVLFGSMLDASKLHSRSDIDLAVWGLPETGTTYFQAVGMLQGLSRFTIDLVEAQYAPDHIQEAIAQGMEL